MTKTDLSTEALLARRELAEKATPGPWYLAEEDADNLLVTSNSRKEMVDIAKCEMAHPEAGMEEPFASEQNANAQHIAANSPDVVIATIGELLRLREEKERLEKEADWLAERLAKYCVDDAEKECPLIDVCPEGSCPTITTSSWREAARRAVEE